MNERTDRLIALARKRGDLVAVATLEADRRYFAGQDDLRLRWGAIWRGLRWSKAA